MKVGRAGNAKVRAMVDVILLKDSHGILNTPRLQRPRLKMSTLTWEQREELRRQQRLGKFVDPRAFLGTFGSIKKMS